MKTSLSYLPQIKQDQILQVADIIKQEANPEKIILFGSYAKGNYVEDQYFEKQTLYEYLSDYDFLVITKNSSEKETLMLDKIMNRCRHIFKTPVNVIIHDINYVNEGLEIGQYFFTEIINEGVLLFENGSSAFAEPRYLTAKEKADLSQSYFDKWFYSGADFLEGAFFYILKKKYNLGAFMLHQSVERFYNTVLLVFTGYKPKTHNLDKLRQHIKPISQDLFNVFPANSNDQEEEHLFNLLKRGYIDARYKDDFSISEKEIKILADRISKIESIVRKISLDKIAKQD